MAAPIEQLQRFGLKLFVDSAAVVSPHACVPIFHRWIQTGAVDGLLIDVADYTHLTDGPRVLLVAHEGGGGINPVAVWESPRLKAKFTTIVVRDTFAYGLDDGVLVCLDLETGERRWKSGRYGHGQVLLVDDLLLVLAESGELFLVDASPAGHRQRARLAALNSRTWNTPALAAPYLLLRNDREAVCYELAVTDG